MRSVGKILNKRRSTGKVNLPFVMPSTLIFILATVNVIGLWINIYVAFIVHAKDTEAYLELIRTPAKTVYQTGQVGAIILADGLMVYRTFVVWGDNIHVVMMPCLTFVATLISGISFVHLEHHMDVHTSIFSKAVTEWTVAFLLSSFVTTVYSTALIAYKLRKTQMNLRRNGVSTSGGLTHRVMRIVVESAVLYSLNHLLYAVLYAVNDLVESTPSFLEASIASITCSLILVRSQKTSQSPMSVDSTVPREQLVFGKYSENQDGNASALRSVEVNVDVLQTVEADTAA